MPDRMSPKRALLVRISQIDARPPAHPSQTEQPTRVTAAVPVLRSGTVAACAGSVPFGRSLMIPHLAALIDLSSAASPKEFAAALASKNVVSAAGLKHLVSWLASSARELERITADQR